MIVGISSKQSKVSLKALQITSNKSLKLLVQINNWFLSVSLALIEQLLEWWNH